MIHAGRARLRATDTSDLPIFVRWLNDPEVRHYLLLWRPQSLLDEERWFHSISHNSSDLVLVAEVDEGGETKPIGAVALHRIDWKNGSAELAIQIGEKDYWGEGYGTELVRAMVQYAFDEMRLFRIELDVFVYNERAKRCYEKVGFQLEGVRRKALFRNGEYIDVIRMGILRDELIREE